MQNETDSTHTGHVVKKERETKMTMEVSGAHATQKKSVCDVLVDIALQQMQSERGKTVGMPEY